MPQMELGAGTVGDVLSLLLAVRMVPVLPTSRSLQTYLRNSKRVTTR